MRSNVRRWPAVYATPSQAQSLRSAACELHLKDEALYDRHHQQEVVASLRDSAADGFDDVVGRMHAALNRAPWFTVVHGLPADQGATLLVALSATLGELVEPYRQKWSRVVRHITPSTDKLVSGHVLNEFLHTDGTDWPEPNDYTCLFCVRQDQRGEGRSRLLDLTSLMEGLTRSTDPGLAARMMDRAVPWRVAGELGGGVHWAPVLRSHPTEIRWLRYTVALTLGQGLAELDAELAEDLARFELAVEGLQTVIDLTLRAGDLMVVGNRLCLHARTAIDDLAGSERELLRTKVKKG